MDYKLILFDIDGTLIDSFKPYSATMDAILPNFDRSASATEIRKTFSMTVPDAIQYLAIEPDREREFLEDYRESLEMIAIPEEPFPGIIEMIDEIAQRNIKLGIVTSRVSQDLDRLNPQSLLQKMNVISTLDKVSHQKPDAEPIIYALNKLDVDKENVLYIGESPSDETAALNANVDFGAASWGADPAAKFTHAKYLFDSPSAVLNVLN